MMRGYSIIGLVNPKTPANVGSAMRACGVYGASQCLFTGRRYAKSKKFITDPRKNYRHIPLVNVPNLKDSIPYDCVPVGVDIVGGAKLLVSYKHPERAFYIFGPEDGTLGNSVLSWCRDVVYVPGNGCMKMNKSIRIGPIMIWFEAKKLWGLKHVFEFGIYLDSAKYRRYFRKLREEMTKCQDKD